MIPVHYLPMNGTKNIVELFLILRFSEQGVRGGVEKSLTRSGLSMSGPPPNRLLSWLRCGQENRRFGSSVVSLSHPSMRSTLSKRDHVEESIPASPDAPASA